MTFSTPAFERYVARAREGRTAVWAFVAGIVVIALVWIATSIVAVVAGMLLSGALTEFILGDPVAADPWMVVDRFFTTPVGLACTLASFCGITIGVFLALRALQRRTFESVLGAGGRLAWGDLWRALVASLFASALAEAATYFVDPSLQRGTIGLVEWLAWLLPLVFLLFVQISAEELAFRGYVLQNLAARFRSPLVWGALPALVFTALHWDPQSLPAMKAAMLLSIAAFALCATVLVIRTGNLGAAMGVHLGLNMFGILIVSHAGWLNGAALFRGRPLEESGWTGTDAFIIGAVSIASFALVILLLLHRRSPLRVGAKLDLPVAGTI